MTMDVVTCVEPGTLRHEQRECPERLAGEVLVRIRRVGVCGTDYHIYGGTQPYLSYPRVMGHELGGEVVEADADSGFAAGDVVCIIPYISCGECIACRQGKDNCCVRIQVLGVHRDGGMAEYLTVPERFVLNAQGLSFDDAAMVEFLAIGRHAVDRGRVRDGQRVLVVGGGPIGMAVALFAGDAGGAVTVIDGRRDRSSFCVERLGAAHAVDLAEDVPARLSAITDGEFYDVVFDATGNARAMEAGFAYVAHGGTYVLVSIVRGPISFDDPEFHKRETTLMGSRNATAEDFRFVIEAIRGGRVPTRAMHTHSAPLAELPDTLPRWIDPATGVIKAIVAL